MLIRGFKSIKDSLIHFDSVLVTHNLHTPLDAVFFFN
jgi:hypothetical protein